MPRRPSTAPADPLAPHRLTAASVESLPTTGRQYRVRDTALPGFAVQVGRGGAKTFTLDFRIRGDRTSHRLTFGTFPAVTPELARQAARQAKAQAQTGVDPAGERRAATERRRAQRDADRAARAAQRAEAEAAKRATREAEERRRLFTVRRLAEDYVADRRRRLSPRTAGLYDSLIRAHLSGAFGAQPLDTLTRTGVRDALRRIADGGALEGTPVERSRVGGVGAARTLRRFLASVWRYARDERRVVSGDAPIPSPTHLGLAEAAAERFLTAAECARLLATLDRAEREGIPAAPTRTRTPASGPKAKHRPKSADVPTPANPIAVAALRFILFTGWRKGEVQALEWSMLRPDLGVAILPETKTGESVRAPSPQAWAVLRTLPRIVGSPYVFPSPRDARRPLADVGRLWDAVRHAAQLEGTRLHDLRHTAASLALNAGASLPEVQSMLGHKSARTTERYAKLIPQTGLRAAEKLAAALETARTATAAPAPVVALPPRRRRARG